MNMRLIKVRSDFIHTIPGELIFCHTPLQEFVALLHRSSLSIHTKEIMPVACWRISPHKWDEHNQSGHPIPHGIVLGYNETFPTEDFSFLHNIKDQFFSWYRKASKYYYEVYYAA